jgi:nitrate reductase gamma subunit
MTTWLDSFLLVGLPYATIAVLLVGILVRRKRRPAVASVPAGRFVESRGHFRATGLLHFGLAAVLAVHIVAVVLPWPLRWWNAGPYRLLVLELLMLSAGFVTVAASCSLLWRRLALPRLRATGAAADTAVAALLVVQSLTGVAAGVMAPWGTAWMTWAASPYLASLCRLDPAVAYLASTPWMLKVHVANGMLLIALLPFTSLGHAVLFPLSWFRRSPLVFRSRGGPTHV